MIANSSQAGCLFNKIGSIQIGMQCGYILGVLMHTTTLDRLWGGDGTLTMWF